MTIPDPGTIDESTVEPERTEDPNRKNALGMSCGFLWFATLATVLAFGLIAFGQLPAALILLIVVPMIGAIEWLTRKAEARSR